MAPPITDCLCCHLTFNALRWQYPCDGCRQTVCRACCRKLVQGVAGNKVTYICDGCVKKGVLLRAAGVQPAGETADLLQSHRRETAHLCREYDSLQAFTVQLECALKRKSQALLELQDLATSTPRFQAPEMLSLTTPLTRHVELTIPLSRSPRDNEEDEEGWLTRKSLGNRSRQSLGGQSSVSRKSGENWEEVGGWEDQEEKIQEMVRQLETLKRQNGELRHKQDHLELALKNERETKQKDFDRFVKLDMKCMKYETQLLEEQEAHAKLRQDHAELQKENEALKANLHNLKAIFEADMDESEHRIQELERNQGWFAKGANPKPRPKVAPSRPRGESFSQSVRAAATEA